MGSTWMQMCRRRDWRMALLLLCLLASSTVQIAAATHWHAVARASAAGTDSGHRQPGNNGLDPDGCLLCQVAAHAGSTAPPPSPWSIVTLSDVRVAATTAAVHVAAVLRPSHSWQGRAPPAV